MKAERKEDHIDIFLTELEMLHLIRGEIVGDRPGVIFPDSKVEVLPLQRVEIDPLVEAKRMKKFPLLTRDERSSVEAIPLKGMIFPNGDIQVIIPQIKLENYLIASLNVFQDQFETPLSEDAESASLKQRLPEKGVIVHFGEDRRERRTK